MSRYEPPRAVPLPGWVYVLTCPSFPGCCKIGGTGRTAKHRADELVGEYTSGQAFAVIERVPVSDWPAVEAAAHRMLSDRRLPRSELFRCSPREAASVVKAAARAHRRPWLGWLSPSPRRSPGRDWNRYKRDDTAGYIALVVLVVVGLVVWLHPALPGWLPPSVVRLAFMLEHVRRF